MERPDAAQASPTILVISPIEEDHLVLGQILNRGASIEGEVPQWKIKAKPCIGSAMVMIRRTNFHVIVCNDKLAQATWRDALQQVSTLSCSPLFIVISQIADEYLWAEALNLGVYDVMAKPLAKDEVLRIMHGAWLRSTSQNSRAIRTACIAAAASGNLT